MELARSKFPGSQNSLDALCKRFKIDNSKRKNHTDLLDCKLLLEVYVYLLDQNEPRLNFEKENFLPISTQNNKNKNVNY